MKPFPSMVTKRCFWAVSWKAMSGFVVPNENDEFVCDAFKRLFEIYKKPQHRKKVACIKCVLDVPLQVVIGFNEA